MYKNYLGAMALLIVLGFMALAMPAQAHGNKQHAAKPATPPITEVTKIDPATAHNDDHPIASEDHNATPHEHDESAQDHHGDEPAVHSHGEGEEEEGHSHWGKNGPTTPFEKFLAYLGNFHALIVHFPIALILTAALAQGLYLAGRQEKYADIVRFTVWIAAFGALGAGLLGWAHAGPTPAHETGVMMYHRWIGTSLLLGGFATAFLMEAARKRSGTDAVTLAFNIALFSMAALVATNGFLGGALAHGGMKHLMPGMMG